MFRISCDIASCEIQTGDMGTSPPLNRASFLLLIRRNRSSFKYLNWHCFHISQYFIGQFINSCERGARCSSSLGQIMVQEVCSGAARLADDDSHLTDPSVSGEELLFLRLISIRSH